MENSKKILTVFFTFQTDVDDCFPNPCQNGGACIYLVDAYICTCQQGFVTKDCEISKRLYKKLLNDEQPLLEKFRLLTVHKVSLNANLKIIATHPFHIR